MDYEGGQLWWDGEAKNSIIIMWQILFDHIYQTQPSAADLLLLMCFFDWQGIPEALLKSQSDQRDNQRVQGGNNKWDSDEDHLSQYSLNDQFKKDIITLQNFSFVLINTDRKTFKMHRLVQLVT